VVSASYGVLDMETECEKMFCVTRLLNPLHVGVLTWRQISMFAAQSVLLLLHQRLVKWFYCRRSWILLKSFNVWDFSRSGEQAQPATLDSSGDDHLPAAPSTSGQSPSSTQERKSRDRRAGTDRLIALVSQSSPRRPLTLGQGPRTIDPPDLKPAMDSDPTNPVPGRFTSTGLIPLGSMACFPF